MSNYDIPDSNESYNNTSNSSRNYVFTNYDYTHTSHKHFYNTHFVLNINDDNRCTLKRIKAYIKKKLLSILYYHYIKCRGEVGMFQI